eukprot:CAMPEP_0168738694 /NCGR_PEP_ID=MMETSP0724-20121128/11069_1 /TAXON_ID=265536 /ORGANISM="Amphiprora sp., Strain CCMP467" /LENGTH=366 /DNA_ID=CAMNT_0008786053 /DNA_START=111 /DNA_END=1208 /DNA_ORIENTATION=+
MYSLFPDKTSLTALGYRYAVLLCQTYRDASDCPNDDDDHYSDNNASAATMTSQANHHHRFLRNVSECSSTLIMAICVIVLVILYDYYSHVRAASAQQYNTPEAHRIHYLLAPHSMLVTRGDLIRIQQQKDDDDNGDDERREPEEGNHDDENDDDPGDTFRLRLRTTPASPPPNNTLPLPSSRKDENDGHDNDNDEPCVNPQHYPPHQQQQQLAMETNDPSTTNDTNHNKHSIDVSNFCAICWDDFAEGSWVCWSRCGNHPRNHNNNGTTATPSDPAPHVFHMDCMTRHVQTCLQAHYTKQYEQQQQQQYLFYLPAATPQQQQQQQQGQARQQQPAQQQHSAHKESSDEKITIECPMCRGPFLRMHQ